MSKYGRPSGREREARLKWQYAHLYPGLTAGEWMPAWLLAEKLAAAPSAGAEVRLCDPSHFEFRGGGARPPELRALRTRRNDAG